MVKLYGFPASPRLWVARAVAAQLGIPLELEIVDLTKGAGRKPRRNVPPPRRED